MGRFWVTVSIQTWISLYVKSENLDSCSYVESGEFLSFNPPPQNRKIVLYLIIRNHAIFSQFH